MSQIERGGQSAQRWPAELPETDNPEGTVGEELRDREGDEQAERLDALPEHERDPNDAVGGGMMSAGGTAEDRGRPEDQPVPSEEGEPRGESGLPTSETQEGW
jgi:hypothetical protein